MTEAIERARVGVVHPLDGLTSEEIAAVRSIVAEAGKADEFTRFAYVGLEEPDKDSVLGWDGESILPRRARVMSRCIR